MKIQMLATVTAAAFIALAANGQGTGTAGAGAAGSSGAGTRIGGTSSGTGSAPARNSGANNSVGFNTAPLEPAHPPGTVTPATPQSPVQNGSIMVAGAGLATNNLGIATNNIALATNNLGLGTNQLGFGQRQSQIPNNSVVPLTPTGTNNNVILLNP
jgi:hypothetical protein